MQDPERNAESLELCNTSHLRLYALGHFLVIHIYSFESCTVLAIEIGCALEELIRRLET